MTKQQRYAGPRCASCGRPFEPRQMQNGRLSETCGQTACVSMHSRKKNNGMHQGMSRRPQTAW
jgi:hypothetical protein